MFHPTPGPLAAMAMLSADFGYVLLFSSIAALSATAAGYFYALRAGKNEILEGSAESSGQEQEPDAEFKCHWCIAFLPIVIPLLLIGLNSFAGICKSSLPPQIVTFLAAAGHPVPALTIGAVFAIFLIGKCRRDELTVSGLMGKSILDAANILVITGAGGAFGEVLKKVDFTSFLPGQTHSMGVFALLIPLGFAAVLKIAQGSSTLAILTAASVAVPMLEPLHLNSPVMRALTCCAVCCGGMIVSHTNDSFFWVVTKFSGMSVRQGLKLQTLGTLVSGAAGASALLVLAWIAG